VDGRLLPDSLECRGNPARLSPSLARVFPPGVTTAELRQPADPSMLFAEEAGCLGDAGATRRQQFTGGRLCARRALATRGIRHFPLAVNRDGCPRWPADVVGSITHAAGICGVAIAGRRQFRAIGLDVEIVEQVTRDLWPRICTSEERIRLASHRERQQRQWAALIFSAKEAFYKCQFGLTRQWLDFHDVVVDLQADDSRSGRFIVRPRSAIALLRQGSMPLVGSFEFQDDLVVAGMVIVS
jgi:4'-phosphopantetheinyl transferase EntD